MESRTATPGGRVLNNSYVANGTAFLQGTTYYSDSDAQVLVTDNSVAELSFSSLTPDLSVTLLQATLGGVTSTFQPVNTNITLTATIRNTGQIDVRNVDVAFFLTNVDANGDGLLDSPTDSFRTSALIGERIIPTVPKSGTITVSVYWTPPGTFETSVPVSVVVDPPLANPADGGAIRETNELNNILVSPLTLFTWPDLAITPADLALLADAVVDNNVPIQVSVHNFGTNTATEATLQFFEAGIPITTPLTITVTAGSTASLVVTWRPSAVGVHNLYAIATTKNDTVRNKDYVFDNNVANMTVNVVTQPDLVLLQSDYAATKNAQQDVAFAITVVVRNEGQTPAANTSVEVYLNGNRSLPWGRAGNVSVLAGSQTNVTVLAKGIPTPSTVHLMMVVDPDNLLNEGGSAEENNNFANLTVIVQPPTGQVNIGTPNNGTVYQPSDTILVQGVVRDNAENGIANLGLNLTVMQNGQPITGMGQTATTDSAGSFAFQVSLVSLADGDYVIRVAPAQQSVASSDATFSVHRNVPFLNQPVPILGIPWWLMLVILAAAAAVIIGVTVYFKVYGLGKMVECGECGAFIPEDATTCPKCGVEFERDMAKCSNCQAWIPVDVKQCPECGVEFATGQVEMADYQEKMRLQYDEVVQKFKEEASRQLGRSLSDREFQDWWRKQPTFVTFEDWLREEEEMRKMGSKPCPVCGTLNSVTATVCHKCGSLLKEQPRPPSGGAGGVPPVARQAAQPSPTATGLQAPPSGGTQAVVPQGQETIPRRVIRKPVSQQPVVQKRVIKRPLGEGQQGESTEGGEGQATDEEKTEDEL
jgi:ribosomal protein L40E